MLIKTAEYKGSYVEVDKCPRAEVPEFAFIGRSNVGKSSLINYLTGRKKLSKISVTPGKTQTINFFDINGQFNFVDLPGYGYAQKSRETRAKWEQMIRNYILKRKQLAYLCVLIDSRIKPQLIDLEFIDWLGSKSIPFILIFTKADKPKGTDTSANVMLFERTLLQHWEQMPPYFITSSEKKHGKEGVLQFIEQQVNAYFKTHPPQGF